MLYVTREEAKQAARTDEMVLQVEGGYIALNWLEAYSRIEAEAADLYQRGWRSWQRGEMMEAFGFDFRHAENICAELSWLEMKAEESRCGGDPEWD